MAVRGCDKSVKRSSTSARRFHGRPTSNWSMSFTVSATLDVNAYLGLLAVDGTLSPGEYDIVVFPHSTVTGDFGGARTVRVRVQ